MRYTLLVAAVISVCTITATLSAQPNWVVVPSDYQYTMTVISVAVVQCTESTDGNDKIAAFINGQVRGVQSLNTNLGGRSFAYMIIYDNEYSGSEITFKIYDASQDTVMDAVNRIEFTENSNIGSVANPLEVKTDYHLTGLFLTRDSTEHGHMAGTAVAEILAVNEIQDTLSIIFDFVDDSSGLDNSYFSIADNQLILLEDANVTMKDRYLIHLRGIAESGCMIDRPFVIKVTGGTMTGASNLSVNTPDYIRLYPNPSGDKLFFDSEKKVDVVSIYDFSGRLVYRSHTSPYTNAIDVSDWSAQTYTVVFQAEGLRVCKKMVVQR